MKRTGIAAVWLLGLVATLLAIFSGIWWSGKSVVPADLLHQLIPPFSADAGDIRVQNHYAMDALTEDYPWLLFWQESVQQREWPLWNPHIFGGHPHAATSMPAVFSPFRWLALALPAERALSLGLLLQLVLAAGFMFLWLQECGRSLAAAALGGLAFALNSEFLHWYWRIPSTFCWAPLILWLLDRSVRRQSRRAVCGSGIALGIAFLSGSIQASAQLGIGLGLYALACGWLMPTQRRSYWTHAAVVIAIGSLIGAVQFLLTAELLHYGAMARALAGDAAPAQPGLRHTLLSLPLLTTFIFPALAGSTETYDLCKLAGATMGDFNGYIGIIPLMLAGFAIMRSREPKLRALGLLVVAVLVIVLLTPLVRFLYHRFFIVLTLAGAAAAAYGLDQLTATSTDCSALRRLSRFALTAGVLGIVSLAVAQWVIASYWTDLVTAGQRYILSHLSQTDAREHKEWLLARVPLFLRHYRLGNPQFWVPLVCLTGLAGAIALWQRARLSRIALIGGLLFLTAADLALWARTLIPQVNLREFPLYPPLAILEIPHHDPGLFRVQQYAPTSRLFFLNQTLVPYRLDSVWGSGSLLPKNLNALPIQNFTPLLDLQNAKYLITDLSASPPPERFELLQDAPAARLYRNRTALPRAWWVGEWTVKPTDAVLPALLDAQFDPHRQAVLETDPQIPPAPRSHGSVQVETAQAQFLRLQVDCASAGLVIVADTFYPGWEARIDGAAVPIWRANYAQRAVAVPAGQHTVEFNFAPRSYRLGAWITLSTLVLACAGLGWRS